MSDTQPDTSWWYLSFVDPDLAPPPDDQYPGGRSWLGACYVDAPTALAAIDRAWELGCNPGGEAAIAGPLTDTQMDEHVPPADRRRMLTRQEVLDD